MLSLLENNQRSEIAPTSEDSKLAQNTNSDNANLNYQNTASDFTCWEGKIEISYSLKPTQ
jgi:hypothetical protein